MTKQKLIKEEQLEAHLSDGWLIKMTTPKGDFVIERKEQEEMPDLKPEEIVKPESPFDQLSDDEVMYWSTPYYDEIQARKIAQAQKIAEEVN